MNSKPNILLLTIDTLRADALGCYGAAGDLTPHLDRLAAGGMRFDQAITNGSWTQAAFPALLTSSYASHYGGCLGPLAADRPSPIEALAESGYETAAFITSPLLGRGYHYHRGFRYFAELLPQERDPLLRRLKGGERWLRKTATHRLAQLFGQRSRPARLYVSAETLTDAVNEWAGSTTTPFFAWAHYMDVHWPYYIEETLERPEEMARAWQDVSDLFRINRRGMKLTDENRQRFIRLYEEAVRYTDAQVGRLLAHLEQAGHLENTVVIVVADHGEEFLERNRWGHFEANLYDEIVRVPLLVRVPGGPAGQAIPQQVQLLDIMPTVCELAGCAAPAGMEGHSLLPLWQEGPGRYSSESAISEMWRPHRHIVAVRTGRYKYIWDSQEGIQPRLYDLQADPAEQHNLVNDCPALAQTFQAQVEAHRRHAAGNRPEQAIAQPVHDPQVLQRLHDLGYVD